MVLDTEKDYIKLLPLDDLYILLEKLESLRATKTEEYKIVLEEIKERK